MAASGTLVEEDGTDVTGAVANGESGANAPELPRWFTIPLAVVIVFVATAGLVGVTLLVLDVYHPLSTVGIAAIPALLVGVMLGHRVEAPRRAAHGPAVIALALALAFLTFNGLFHSEHVLTDRDPAIYVNTGRSIARHHELRPVIRSGAFADGERFSFSVPSMGVNGDDRLVFGFYPMLSALLALGSAAGGDVGLLLVGVVLGALGLLCAYALGSRVAGPWWGLFVPLFLAVNPLPGWFARDATSEVVVQLLVAGGVWLYLLARSARSPTVTFLAGAVIGAACLARVDGVAIVFGMVLFGGIEWLRGRDERVPNRRAVLAFVAGMLVLTYVSDRLVNQTVRGYLLALLDQYNSLLRLLAAGIGAVVLLAAVDRIAPTLRSRVARFRSSAAVLCSAGLIGAALWAYFVRPKPLSALPVRVAGEASAAEVKQAITAWHRTQTLHWLADWFGPVTLAVALAGLVVLIWWLFRGDVEALAIVLLVVPLTCMYLARPSIAPDHPWAMRRFLVVAIPGIAVALSVVLRALYDRTRTLRRRPVRGLAVGGVVMLGVALLGPSAQAAAPLLQARNQHGALDAVHDLCRAAGADGAVFVYGRRYVNLEFPQTLRSFCGIPVAKVRGKADIDIVELAEAWKREGRTLYVLTAVPDKIRSLPGARVVEREHVVVDDRYLPRPTRNDRSRELKGREREVWLFEIQPLPDAAAPPG
jgi:hypothetical protein